MKLAEEALQSVFGGICFYLCCAVITKLIHLAYNREVMSVRLSLQFFSLRDDLDFDKIWYRYVHVKSYACFALCIQSDDGQLTVNSRSAHG